MYTQKLIEAFQKPKHSGEIKNPDFIGKAGNPVCGDVMWIYVKVKDKKKPADEQEIKEIKFKTMGCAAAIGTSEMICRLSKGKKLKDAVKISKQDIADSLDGLPPIKMHCSVLATEALKHGFDDYKKSAGKEKK
jgi:nitrogen fixation NifU-like protein